MKKTLPVIVLLLFAGLSLTAQEVAKRIVVEHFTNTRCGICGSRNPALIDNLEANPDVIHLSIHPRFPYPNCILYQHNPDENSARTTYYGPSGTPSIYIQGERSTASFGSSTLFDNVRNETTPIEIELYQVKADGRINIDVVITAMAENNIATANLFLAAAEEIVNYDAPNGEDEHHHVFRRTFTQEAGQGLAVDIPSVVGATTMLSYSLETNDDWDFSKIYAVAILNDAMDKSVIQAAASDPAMDNPLTNIAELNTIEADVFPNPVADQVVIRLPEASSARAMIFDLQGRLLLEQRFDTQTQIDVTALPAGAYLLELRTSEGTAVEKLIKR